MREFGTFQIVENPSEERALLWEEFKSGL